MNPPPAITPSEAAIAARIKSIFRSSIQISNWDGAIVALLREHADSLRAQLAALKASADKFQQELGQAVEEMVQARLKRDAANKRADAAEENDRQMQRCVTGWIKTCNDLKAKLAEEKEWSAANFEKASSLLNDRDTLAAELAAEKLATQRAVKALTTVQSARDEKTVEVENLRKEIATADGQTEAAQKALTALRTELAAFKAIAVETVAGEHGEGVEQPCSAAYLKAWLDDLQKNWDGAESLLMLERTTHEATQRREKGLREAGDLMVHAIDREHISAVYERKVNMSGDAVRDLFSALDHLKCALADSSADAKETSEPSPDIMAACEQARKQMNSYTPEQRAELEVKAYAIIDAKAGAGTEENANVWYERIAEVFFRKTGMMAPGKDSRDGAFSYEERQEAWSAFIKEQRSSTPDKVPQKTQRPLAPSSDAELTDDECLHCLVMYQTVMGGGVAAVGHDEARRLEELGLVKLLPADEADCVDGEILPEYAFTMTPAGETVARDYRDTSFRAIRKGAQPEPRSVAKPRYEPKGTRFMDRATGREMILTTVEGVGWICYKHPDDFWVTLRKATMEDHAAIAAAQRTTL
jgi:hypothetical protein